MGKWGTFGSKEQGGRFIQLVKVVDTGFKRGPIGPLSFCAWPLCYAASLQGPTFLLLLCNLQREVSFVKCGQQISTFSLGLQWKIGLLLKYHWDMLHSYCFQTGLVKVLPWEINFNFLILRKAVEVLQPVCDPKVDVPCDSEQKCSKDLSPTSTLPLALGPW